jgi:hypothetical protein
MRGLGRRLEAQVARLGPCDPARLPPITEADVERLPEPARRYLRWMGVVDRPRDEAFRARFRGRIRMRPGQRWMRFDARRGAFDPSAVEFVSAAEREG